MIKFRSVIEMLEWLIDNEGHELKDGYGRAWKYERFKFYFKEIGNDSIYVLGMDCLHLFGTITKPGIPTKQ